MNLMEFSWRDFKKNKVRAIFGIGGITISIFLLSTVGILIDSLSFSYLDVATNQAGSADIMFMRNVEFEGSLEFYMNQTYIEDTLDVEEIDYFYPRILMLVDVDSAYTEESSRLFFYGINSTREQDSGRMGDLYKCDPVTLEKTDNIYRGPIPSGKCIVLKNTANLMNVTEGDWIELTYAQKVVNLTVDAVCVQDLRFSAVETTLVITELPVAQDFLDQENKVNYVMATLKNREQIYDVRDIDGTTERIREIGTKIQQQIGFDYQISLPKMQQLEFSEFANMMMEVMLIFVSILCLLISGILINSILSTSIEERIREFGILRILGGKGRDNVYMVVYQGFFMGLLGSIIGILLSIFAVPPLLTLIFDYLELWANPIPFVILPETILQSFALGVVTTLVISIFPALKAGKLKISEAIDPFRQSQEESYTLTKEGSPNTKIILIGLAVASIGLLIFVMFPRLIALQDPAVMSSFFMILMLAILLGLVCAFIGFVPAIEWIFLQIFKPFIRKYSAIVHLSLKRNRRRNTGNVLMFSLTFSFIFFVSSFLAIRTQMIRTTMEFQYGGDLVIVNQGSFENSDAIDYEFLEGLEQMAGVEEVAPIMHNTIDAAEILSILFTATEGSVENDALFSMFSQAISNTKYNTYAGDVAAYNYVDCGFIGVNQSYVDMSKEEYMIWDNPSGSNTEDSFDALFDPSRNDTVIIAKSLADLLGVDELGDKIRMAFAASGESGSAANTTTMTVVGISGGMPGFWNFRSASYSAWSNAGVMMALDNYKAWMDEDVSLQGGTPNEQIYDKILLNLEDHSQETIDDAKVLMEELYGDEYSFLIDDNISKIEMSMEGQDTIQLILEVVLTLTVLISLFGLISTMYSTLLERMYEVGLLRSMGLRTSNVRGIFIAESLIMMLSAGTMGLFIGSFIAYEMVSNIALLTEMPIYWQIDMGTLLQTYAISISVCVLGILAITRKIKKWTIMDIFRQTF